MVSVPRTIRSAPMTSRRVMASFMIVEEYTNKATRPIPNMLV